jgi:RNA polymerase subunit RPABC4/transcription elongation factor Spt4
MAATMNGWDFEPLFAKKCLQCDEEFDSEPDNEICPNCFSDKLRDPDTGQLRAIKEMFKTPNHDLTGRIVFPFEQILKDWVWYNQSIDDFFGELSFHVSTGNPREIWPLPGEYMRHVDDEISYSGWYCHVCWPETQEVYAQGDIEDDGELCPTCERPLEETEWLQLIEDGTGKILARFSAKRIMHGNGSAYGGRRWGLPKTLAVWYIAQTLRWMEMRQWSAYSQNMSPDVALVFPGMSQEDVNKTATDVIEFKKRKPGKMVQLWLGAQEAPIAVRMNDNLVDLQTVQMANFYREAVAVVYGVSMQMLGVSTPGKLGDETEQIEVSYNTVEQAQRTIEMLVNTKLLPLYFSKAFGTGEKIPMITDWKFVLKEPRKEDRQRQAQVIQGNLQVAQLLEQMGYPIELNEQDYFLPSITGPRTQPQGGAMPGMGGDMGGMGMGPMDEGLPGPEAGLAEPEGFEDQLEQMSEGESIVLGEGDFEQKADYQEAHGGQKVDNLALDMLLSVVDNVKDRVQAARDSLGPEKKYSSLKSELMAYEQNIDNARRAIEDAKRESGRFGTLHDQGLAVMNPIKNLMEMVETVTEELDSWEGEAALNDEESD